MRKLKKLKFVVKILILLIRHEWGKFANLVRLVAVQW